MEKCMWYENSKFFHSRYLNLAHFIANTHICSATPDKFYNINKPIPIRFVFFSRFLSIAQSNCFPLLPIGKALFGRITMNAK